MPTFTDKLTEKDKKNIRIALVIVAVIAVIIGISSFTTDDKKTSKKREVKSKKGKFSLLTDQVEKESWIAAQGHNIKKLQQENEDFKRNIDEIRQEMTKLQNRHREFELETKRSFSPKQLPHSKDNKDSLPPLPRINSSNQTSKEVDRIRVPKAAGPGLSLDSIKVFSDTSIEKEKKKESDIKTKKEAKQSKLTLSSGSFMRATLLNGIDAPTDFAAKSEPYPVLLNIDDITKLPNFYRMNLRNCYVVGAGYGNLADERAYIRTEKLSCVSESGKVIDVKLKGHIIGEDGKLGLRGTLVSKQGQLIAQSLIAGTLGGLAKAFKPQQSVSINLGSNSNDDTSAPSAEDLFKSAGAEGVSTAANKVADFYLKMAEKIFPIIEIGAGRKVDILVLDQTILEQSGSVNENIGG